MKRVAGWAAVVCAAAVLAGCSSTSAGKTKPAGAAATSTGKADAASALAAAPGAIAAAKTLTVDATGTIESQTVRVTTQFAFSGTPGGSMDIVAGAAAPKDHDNALPPETKKIVANGTEYDLAATMLAYKDSDTAARLAARMKGRLWVSVLPGSDAGLQNLQPGLIFGTLQNASDNPGTALAALLASGLLAADPAPGPGGTFHYTGTLDRDSMKTAKYPGQQGEAIMDEIRTHAASEKIEVWLAPDGLPTEIKVDQHTDPALDGATQAEDAHLAWNKPLTAAAPAASDVTTQDELFQ